MLYHIVFGPLSPRSLICSAIAIIIVPGEPRNFIQHCRDAWHVQYLPHERNVSKPDEHDGKEVLEKVEETESLHDHACDRPASHDHANASEKGHCKAQPLSIGKKFDRPLQAAEKGKAGQEENVAQRQQRSVKKKHDAKPEKKNASKQQEHANLFIVIDAHHGLHLFLFLCFRTC